MSQMMMTLPLLILAVVTMLSFLLLAYQKARMVPILAIVSVIFAMGALLASIVISNDGLAFAFAEVQQITPHLVVDGFSRLHAGIVLLSGLVILLIQLRTDNDNQTISDVTPAMSAVSVLLLMVGGLLTISADGLLVLFLGIEIMGLGTLGLLSFGSEQKPAGQPKSLTPLVMSTLLRQAVSSSLLLFGFALLFAHSGSVTYAEQNRALLYDTQHPLLLLGSVMVLFSLLYKLAYIPMQAWFTQMQQKTSHRNWMPLMLVMQFVIFIGLVRFLAATAVPAVSEVTVVLMVLAIMGLVVSVYAMLTADRMEHFVFYTVLAQMAFVLVVMLSLGQSSVVVANMLLVSMMLGVLLVSVALHYLLSVNSADNKMLTLSGIFHCHPRYTVILSLGLLVLAGLPLTVGFMSKFFTLMATVQGLDWLLTSVVVISSVAIWYAVMKQVYRFVSRDEPEKIADTSHAEQTEVESNVETELAQVPNTYQYQSPLVLKLLTVILVTAVIGLGVYPEPLIQLAKLASIG